MENTFGSRYRDSQDHLIITLNQQIQALIPLKESYMGLQRLQIKIVGQLDAVLQSNKLNSKDFQKDLKELSLMNQQLDHQKGCLIQELRLLQNESAKMIYQKKNLLSANESSNSRYTFENEQSIAIQKRSRDLLEQIRKIQHNISLSRKIVNDLEKQVKLKENQNIQLREQISRKNTKNKTLSQKVDTSQDKIKKVGAFNDKLMHQIHIIEKQINQSQIRIRDQFKKGKSIKQSYLQQRQRLSNLDNQKQYYSRLIHSQILVQEDLQISQEKLQALIDRRTYQLQAIEDDCTKLDNKLQVQVETKHKNIENKEKLTVYLAQLIKTNTMLLQNMDKCCSQDRKVHSLLDNKVTILSNSWSKIKGTLGSSTSGQNPRKALEDIHNICKNQKIYNQTLDSIIKSSGKYF